ncbi:MAG: pantoate--beta-alanine ligase, partial [Candidatus Dormibacteraceae bacterium]
MRTVVKISEMRALAEEWRCDGQSIGLVPTMGALHEGHLSLIRRARVKNQRVVVSIFVNQLQFGPREDWARYPRQHEQDLALLNSIGIDAVFLPAAEEMHRPGNTTRVHVGALGNILEGASRPGHFEGVATVVIKLFNICRPHSAYFGQKDAQQETLITKVARELDTGVEVNILPIVRDFDGLALSSRNAYLSIEERTA